ncbi:hypothetical protein BC940DRAFT_348586 [Gongronella butleri]|nr:hypothetical protein BC940DRAFT_348586 [Gongronella butleri]
MTSRKQIFSVRLNREAFNSLMKHPQPMKVDIQPSASAIYIGERSFDLSLRHEQSTIVVYEKNQQTRQDGEERILYVGDVTHIGHMRQVLSEEDKKRMRSRTEQSEKEKHARRIELLDVPNIPTPSRKNPNNVNPIYKRKVGHIAAASPLPSSPASRLDPIAQKNLRERLVHLLALEQRSTDQLTNMLKVSLNDLSAILKKVAMHAQGQWILRPEVYKDIRIWEWSRYDDKERALVRRKAEEAYNNILHLPRNAPERANLVPRKPHRLSPKLIPPPSQATPNSATSSVTTAANTPSSANSATKDHSTPSAATNGAATATPVATAAPKPPVKRHEPADEKTSVQKKRKSAPTSSSTTTTAAPVPKATPPGPKKSAKTPATSAAASSHVDTHEAAAPMVTVNGAASGSSEDDDTDASMDAGYVAPTIHTQSDFDALCKEHQDAQHDYVQFKKVFVRSHPLYVEALAAVRVDEAGNDKLRLAKQLKSYYKAKGGDMAQWRRLMVMSRRFNTSHTKVNLMWDTIAKAYRQNKFTLKPSFIRKHK